MWLEMANVFFFLMKYKNAKEFYFRFLFHLYTKGRSNLDGLEMVT